ncbi:long-chain fatty acid--CoA ligase [Shewanella sp. SR44-3]|uniref:AMP-dependent synthetase/ligase n=1 Tax=unclassified Shewanella TaxID=196818 RepID=UPI0015F7F26F|nr:long-chain fatty acid--CoA ligase [Shewanella sp. SR44-3]MBB1268463.1 long-chain fatty acid--CoA ligase [Shewanella sp. SR44-3]
MSLEQYHLVQLLQQQSQQRADCIALEGFELAAPWQQVSWKAFDSISHQVAKAMIKFGLQAQDTAVILSQNCPQWTCVDVGLLKARAVVVPVYPSSTQEQASFIINDAGAKVLFIDDAEQYHMACKLQAVCPSVEYLVVFDASVALLDTPNHVHFDSLIAADLSTQDEALAERLQAANLDDLLTLIYTSGTTGEPKGVMLDYRNMASTIRQHDTCLNFTPGDTSLAFLPLSHVFERSWSFFALCRGGHNVYLKDTMKIKEAIVAVRPHTLCVVPRFLEKVYSAVQDKVSKAPKARQRLFHWAMAVGTRQFEVNQGRAKPSKRLSIQWKLANKLVYSKLQAVLGGRLKFMPCGGASLDVTVVNFFHAICVPVLCGYGMTETNATVTMNTLDNRVPGSNGKPLPETQVKLGENDEIMVRGDAVMRGYYKRAEDTAATFEDGWLKTGDAGRLDEQGNLFITDRIKELMKTSNGKYIAPQRVEGKVGSCPFIEQVAIIADGRNFVSALIVPAFEALEHWAKEQNIAFDSMASLLARSEVLAHFEERLLNLQHDLAAFEQIKKFTLLTDAFTIEAGLITPTLKLRRKAINQKYGAAIDAMYTH